MKEKRMQNSGLELKKNQIIPLEITGYTAEGSGVGKYHGIAVFVPLAAVGDKLKVQILKVARSFAYGKIEKVLTPSADRIQPDCQQFSRCGGCVYRHISYAAELRAKQQRVEDALERIGGLRFAVLKPIVGAQQPDRYRNKAQLPIGAGVDGRVRLGFYATHSHRIIDCCSQKNSPAPWKLFRSGNVRRKMKSMMRQPGTAVCATCFCAKRNQQAK